MLKMASVFRCSSSLEVSNEVTSILLSGDSGESHSVTGSEARGTLEPLVEVTVSPLESSLGGES